MKPLKQQLNDPIIKAAKPKAKPYNLVDGNGLVLIVQPNGAKWWRYRYRFNGKAKMLSLGVYPDVTLKMVRVTHEKMIELLTKGIDPSQTRKEKKRLETITNENTFKAVALLWHDYWKVGKSERHALYVLRRLETDIFPAIGHKPITEITAPIMVMTVEAIQKRGALDIAKRALETCGQVFRYAIARGLAERNPCADFKPADVLKSVRVENYARIDIKDYPKLLTDIDQYRGRTVTKLAMQLLALTFVRTSELIGAKWDEFSFDGKVWTIPEERMKMKTTHIVPLTKQAIVILKALQEITGGGDFLFPNDRSRLMPMSNNAILKALERMGYKGIMTGHGFRGLASTVLHEQGYPHEHIELQLAHLERNKVSAAYNHATYLKQRTKMMQDWADFLDQQRAKGMTEKLGIKLVENSA